MSKNELINNFSTWIIFKNISITNIKKEITVSELAKAININRHHPYFCEILDYLLKEKIIKVAKIFGKTRLITIDIKKLDKIIEESDIYKEFQQYIHMKKSVYANI
jgi:hypothetical protein